MHFKLGYIPKVVHYKYVTQESQENGIQQEQKLISIIVILKGALFGSGKSSKNDIY